MLTTGDNAKEVLCHFGTSPDKNVSVFPPSFIHPNVALYEIYIVRK